MRTRFALLSLGALFAVSIVLSGSLETRANHAGGMNAMSIDMDEEASPANTSSALGTRELCRRINENNLLDADEDVVDGLIIDTTARDVPAYNTNGTPGDPSDDSGGIIAYSYEFHYSSANLTIDAQEYNSAAVNILRRNPGGTGLINVSDTLPDNNVDNVWLSAVLDGSSFNESTPESGSGVLDRLTLVSESGATAGFYPLTLASNVHVDAEGEAFFPDSTNDAYVAIDSACGDLDGDGVPDEQDSCYTLPGSPPNGCPPPTSPRPPAVGGSAGLITDTRDGGAGPATRALIALVAASSMVSLAGVVLVRQLVVRKADR